MTFDDEFIDKMKNVARPFEKKLEEDGNKVDNVDKVDDSDYIVKFNQGASWDCYREIIEIAASNFKVVTEYEYIGTGKVRFRIEEKDVIDVTS